MATEIHGHIKPGFEKVGDAFQNNFEELRELGASAAIWMGGESVVDIWGGNIHDETTPWQANTLVNVWSTTKGFATLAMHILKSRGQLDFDLPVAHYWQEFGAAGKAEIPVRYILTHRSGMAGWQKKVNVDVLYDWDQAVNLLAEQEPFWEPGTASGYHLLSYGHLVGEIVKRIDGRNIAEFIQQEIVQPLDLDFCMPLSEAEFGRVSDVVLMPTTSQIPQTAREKLSEMTSYVFTNPLARVYDANSSDWRKAVIPAANGHCSARDVAKLYGTLASDANNINGADGEEGGGNNSSAGVTSSAGVRLLSPDVVEGMREPAPAGVDLILGAGMGQAELVWGMGYRINHDLSYGPNSRAFYHGGFGGSLGLCDPEKGFGFGYVMNRMDLSSRSGSRAANLLQALYKCLD